jgi:hypothetical protein
MRLLGIHVKAVPIRMPRAWLKDSGNRALALSSHWAILSLVRLIDNGHPWSRRFAWLCETDEQSIDNPADYTLVLVFRPALDAGIPAPKDGSVEQVAVPDACLPAVF